MQFSNLYPGYYKWFDFQSVISRLELFGVVHNLCNTQSYIMYVRYGRSIIVNK